MAGKASRQAWVPAQHGAWAMLVVPFAVGALLRLRDAVGSGWFLLPLFACWMLGYFAFNAASFWLKAALARRPSFVKPVVVYASVTGLAGIVTLLTVGWPIIGWVPVFAVLLTPALVLAAQRRERATLGGALTTLAASVMTLVARYPDPTALFAWTPQVRQTAVTAALVFAYFFGTVLYVKTNIRERNSRAFYVASVGWHAIATIAGALTDWRWGVLFGVATIRAIVVPRLHLTPKQIGLAEVALCVAILAIVWA